MSEEGRNCDIFANAELKMRTMRNIFFIKKNQCVNHYVSKSVVINGNLIIIENNVSVRAKAQHA